MLNIIKMSLFFILLMISFLNYNAIYNAANGASQTPSDDGLYQKGAAFPKTSNTLADNGSDPEGKTATNWVSFFPDVELADINKMKVTNGISCMLDISSRVPTYGDRALLKPPVCWVSIFNHSVTPIGCLRMSATNLCRISLSDKNGKPVEKTSLGKLYGGTLSQEFIGAWRHNWTNTHERMLIRLWPNVLPKYVDDPTDIFNFALKDAFEIKEAGEYELHLQARIVQVAKNKANEIYYPVTWLPEVVGKVMINEKDLSP